MALEIHQREKEGITILDLKGRLVLGSEDEALQRLITVLRDDGSARVIVNLHEVSHVDNSAFESVISMGEGFKKSGGKLVLLDGRGKGARLSDVQELDVEIEVYANEQDAINSFFPDRVVPHFDILEFVEEEEHLAPPPKKE